MAAVLEVKRQEYHEKYTSLSPEIIDQFAQRESKHELRKRVPLVTIEEVKASREQGPVLLPKQVPESATADAVKAEAGTDTVMAEEPVIEQLPPNGATNSPDASEERGVTIAPSPEPATPSGISKPPIEFIIERPMPEPGSESIESNFV